MKAYRGFSLVELLVALVLSGILMAGMAKVFSTSISALHRTGELVGTQRRNRWILNEFGDDLRMAGFTDGLVSLPLTFAYQPFQIRPGNNGSGSDWDEIDLFMNEPILEARLAADTIPGSNSIRLEAVGGGSLNIQTSDLMLIKDGEATERCYSNGNVATGQVVTLMDSDNATLIDPKLKFMMSPGVLQFHRAGTAVTVIRPWQLIHYGIENRSLDPSDPGLAVPCLVRKQADFDSGAQADWSTVTGEVVAENVSGLRLELSVDGGVHWEHGDTWAATVALANSRLSPANQIDPNSLWFKRVPAQIRVEIHSRTPLARTEYATTPGTTAFKERTQVLVVSPRNFASPL